jgi:hypothetical protein
VTKLGRPKKTRKERVSEKALWKRRCKFMGRRLPPLNKAGFLPAWTLTRLRAAWEKHEKTANMTGEM